MKREVTLLILVAMSIVVAVGVGAWWWLSKHRESTYRALRRTIDAEADIVLSKLDTRVFSHDRGIVMCAGGASYLAEAFASLLLVRLSGCRLPVCIVYADPGEVSDADKDVFYEEFGRDAISFIDASRCDLGVRPTKLRGFEIKPYAVLLAPFKHVLLLDADCSPLTTDPTYLFDNPTYVTFGHMFWPDYWRREELIRSKFINSLVKIPRRGLAPAGYDTESGQFVVDTSRCLRGLVYAWLLNKHGDVFYKAEYGDKNLFRLGFAMADIPFYQGKFAPGLLGAFVDDKQGIRLLAMVQKCPRTGKPLFAHRTQHKVLSKQDIPVRMAWEAYVPNDGEHDGIRSSATYSSRIPGFTCIPELCDQLQIAPESWQRLFTTLTRGETSAKHRFQRIRGNDSLSH